MISANSSSLIHFTHKMSTLKLILRNGIRYSYAFESLPQGVLDNLLNETTIIPTLTLNYNNSYGVALPMVSFCDIPLTRASEHSKLYGKYGIGIEKDYMLYFYKEFFNPVIYSSGDSLDKAIHFFSSERLRTMDRILDYTTTHMEKNLCNEFLKVAEHKSSLEALQYLPQTLQNEFKQRLEESYNISIVLALYKPYKGINSFGKEQVFYDEREWRAFYPHANEAPYYWYFPCTRNEFLTNRDELNTQISKCEDSYITIPQNYYDAISHIIVKNDYQRDSIIQFILNTQKLFGFPIERNSKLKYKIISKISSFEETENDY